MPKKTFVAGEVLAASDVNTYLMDQAVMTFAGSAARGSAIASPSEGMITYLDDTDKVEYYDGTNWSEVTGTQPGMVLQVVSTTKTDTFSTNATSYTDVTGLSVTITPSSATSDIMVFVDLKAMSAGANSATFFQIVRDSTSIAIGDAAGSRPRVTGGAWQAPEYPDLSSLNGFYLDSPATTSAVTYKIQMRNLSSGNLYVNRTSLDTDGVQPRAVSTITVMEIAG